MRQFKWITYALFKEGFDHFLVHGGIFIHLWHKRCNSLLCIFLHCQTTRQSVLVIEDCGMASSCPSSRAHVTRAPAHLPPSSCSPPLNTFEGEERRSSQLPGLRTCPEQVCWTGSSIQPDMSPMVERSVCRSERNGVSSGVFKCTVGWKHCFNGSARLSPLMLH